ncbi:MAG: type I 3-dehydroquinate dehydratase [Planctomycetota bacterium]|nr:type I 3-dehydroquinate dehydratase [Planctomycetota bacterium]MDA0917726.1 type I 3-dehydroquinate dehydratase [Planctomycetota bacterium]MDA1158058.1 type I 3-dehydroquinate dehydratase [Planctomycetota bacterium]
MICVSITPEHRTLAKVDLLNAARQADLVELCLDRLTVPLDLKGLLDGVVKPVIISCRRPQDGGAWAGTEDERFGILRQAMLTGAAYVEIEADVAHELPRTGTAQRIISFTSLRKPLENVPEKIDRAALLSGDVVKFTWPTPTLDAAWPLLAAVSRKCALPVVGVGIGAAGRTFSLLGRKYGSPWVYASLEKGMETHDGQATVNELDELYACRDITPKTQFVGIVGFGESRLTMVRLLNDGFRDLDLNTRCVPLEIGDLKKLRQMLDLLQVGAVLTNRHLGEHLLPLAQHSEEAARVGTNCDLLLKKSDGWHAYNLIWRSTLRLLEKTLRRSSSKGVTLDRSNILVLGAGRLSRTMLYGIRNIKGSAALTASHDNDEAVLFCGECGAESLPAPNPIHQLAEELNARYLPFSEISKTSPDVLIMADTALELGFGEHQLNPTWLRPPMTIVDITQFPEESDLLAEARERGCTIVRPSYIFSQLLSDQFKAVTGQELPTHIFYEALGLQ